MNPSIGIVTLNAKYIHSSLSVRYLRNAARQAGFDKVWIGEFIIHQPVWKIAGEILKLQPDVLGLSVYIWNRAQSFELIEYLRSIRPGLAIVLGGPEVSFESEAPTGVTLIAGEGETKWVEYLEHVRNGTAPDAATLKRWRTYGNDLPDLSMPYLEEDLPALKNRYAYLETSRGCPYLCSFCLSALDTKVRYFDEVEVHRQIKQLVRAGIRKIKFVDRTFNLNPRRVRPLMEWLTQFDGTEFHFEVVGDLLRDDMIQFLETVPPGMFQFEIGIQTVTEPVQELIHRKQDRLRLFDAIRTLVRQNRVHLHCDLIFGLPGETVEQAMASFTEVFRLKPHELQLGFLKFLPGAPIRETIEEHGYRFQSGPPYEVIAHKNMSGEEVLYLKKFAETFDLFYNSKRFRFSIDRLAEHLAPREIFDRLARHLDNHEYFQNALSLDNQYKVFAEVFGILNDPEALDLLKLDYLYNQRTFRLPAFLQTLHPPAGTRWPVTWAGDRKTPVIPFRHFIEFDGATVRLIPSPAPVLYAVAHPEEGTGYFTCPRVVPVET